MINKDNKFDKSGVSSVIYFNYSIWDNNTFIYSNKDAKV